MCRGDIHAHAGEEGSCSSCCCLLHQTHTGSLLELKPTLTHTPHHTLQGQPIRLWDACSGALRASYRGYDEADEVTAAFSIAFSPDGGLLLAGYSKALRVFDVGRPGRDCRRIQTHRKKQEGSIPGWWMMCVVGAAVEVL